VELPRLYKEREEEFPMPNLTRLLLLASVGLAAQTVWSAPTAYAPLGVLLVGGASGFDSTSAQPALFPQNEAYFRAGMVRLSHAVALEKKRDLESNPAARERLNQKVKDDYVRARQSFQYAISGGDNNLGYVPGALTNLAYAANKLGDHDAALTASERALALAPGLAVARENRGEALLGLNRIADAKRQYLDLYPGQPVMAALLLSAM
jgi:tetratricopeptide (TPR) repeat protein